MITTSRVKFAVARRDLHNQLRATATLVHTAADTGQLVDMLGPGLADDCLSVLKRHGPVSASLYPIVRRVAELGRDTRDVVEQPDSDHQAVAARLFHELWGLAEGMWPQSPG